MKSDKELYRGGKLVNMHFRCRVWLAQILDVIHCDLFLGHLCDIYKVIRHENANLFTFSVVYCCTHHLLRQPF